MDDVNQQGLEKDFETFINLILVACQDDEIKSQLLTILDLPWNARSSLLKNFIEKMKQQEAPADFVAAIELLKSEEIAIQVHEVLNQ